MFLNTIHLPFSVIYVIFIQLKFYRGMYGLQLSMIFTLVHNDDNWHNLLMIQNTNSINGNWSNSIVINALNLDMKLWVCIDDVNTLNRTLPLVPWSGALFCKLSSPCRDCNIFRCTLNPQTTKTERYGINTTKGMCRGVTIVGVPGGLNSSGTAEYCGDKGWGGRLSGSGDAQASRQRAKGRP